MNVIAVGFYVEGNRIKLDLFELTYSILNVILGIFLNCSYFLHKICIFGAVAVHIALLYSSFRVPKCPKDSSTKSTDNLKGNGFNI